MDQLGIQSADIGLPGASPRAREEIVALAKETTRLRIAPNVACRTHPADIAAAIQAAVESGVAIETCAFIGSSPIRRVAERWSLDTMREQGGGAGSPAGPAGPPGLFVPGGPTRGGPQAPTPPYATALAGRPAR